MKKLLLWSLTALTISTCVTACDLEESISIVNDILEEKDLQQEKQMESSAASEESAEAPVEEEPSASLTEDFSEFPTDAAITPERAYAAYENIIKEYQSACAVESSEWFAHKSEYLSKYPDVSSYILDNYHTPFYDDESGRIIPYEIAYMYFDVDQNGIPELFMIEGFHEANVFAVFTFDGNQAVDLKLAQPEEYDTYLFYTDGIIQVVGGLANGYKARYFVLEPDGYTVRPVVLTEEEVKVRLERQVLISNDKFTILAKDIPAENHFSNSEINEYIENAAYFLTSDYDGNGTEESFLIMGTFDGVAGYMDAEILFLDSNGTMIQVCDTAPQGDSLYGYLNPRNGKLEGNETNDYLIPAGNARFLAWEVSAYGSASTSLIFGVRDGKPYELDISGEYMGFHQDEAGRYVAVTSDFSKGYHDYIEQVFAFDEETKQFILQ